MTQETDIHSAPRRSKRHATDAPFPLTPVQQGMYLESTGSGRPWLYLEQIVCHLENEEINTAAMQAAWTDITASHAALRLTIETGDMLTQSVQPPGPVEVAPLDWRTRTTEEVSQGLQDFLALDRNQGVAAENFPSFRVTLIETGPKEGKLIWTFPHSLLDGRSFAHVLTEVFTRYEGHCTGSAPPLAPHPQETAPLFAEHCHQLNEIDHAPGVSHFARMLQGWEGGEGLVDNTIEAGRKSYVEHNLSQRQTRALTKLAEQADVPLSTLILTAWGVVTARFAGRDDTVFGNTRTGRHLLDDSYSAIGCFIVTVPMRLRLKPGHTLGRVLADMRADQIAQRPFEQTPLTRIRAKTDVPPGVALFDTLVMFETATLHQQMRASGRAWQQRRVDLLEEGNIAVTLAAYQGDALGIVVEYDTAQVPDGPRLAAYMADFLRNLTMTTPETPLAEISMLDECETDRLRDMSGEFAARQNKPAHCLELFTKQRAALPDHLAVTQPGAEMLNYNDLDRAANRLAHLLIQNGVKPHDVVGICTIRSPVFVLALLAIWKAGAAFVPMDPTYPSETLDIIAQDSATRLILTDAHAHPFDSPVLDLSLLSALDQPDTAPDLTHAPADPAYVVFTSGSTGRPKGVMVSHASLAAHAAAAQKLYEITPQDRVLQFASLSFDVALEEIVATLLSGASLIMRTPEMSQSVGVFLEQCRASEISLLNLPTGFWVALTDALEGGSDRLPESVRLVIVGGERVPLSVLRRWRALIPDIPWINGYGPTETTITCTAHRLAVGDLRRGTVPIGTPLGHAAAWVLTPDGALAPEGTQGELWISGPAVAMGYIRSPNATKERFVKPGFDPAIGRSYGTGDRVFWRDGVLHYVGRVDRQIKLRGFRIEPSQIEQVIEGESGVARAHVALQAPDGGQDRLVAWYSSADPQATVDPDRLRKRLAEALPAHMRPEPVHVDIWPQTPGGKIDTTRLPTPTRQTDDLPDTRSESPLTDEVARLFGEILKLDTVPGSASFFDMGGDSLLLLRLIARIEKDFGVRLKSTNIYADPTPMGVVRALQQNETDPLIVIPIQPEGHRPPLYAVHVLGDHGSFFRPLTAELSADQPLFGLTVGLLTEETPTTVEDLARFYLHQIERHHPQGPVSLIAVSAGSYVTFELAQQLTAAGRDVRALVFVDASGPGGRPRVGALGRIGAHARRFSRAPFRYIARTCLSKLDELRLRTITRNLAQNKWEAKSDAVNSVATFVAANAMSIEAYEPLPYQGRISIIRAAHDLFDSPDAITTGLGWDVVAGAGFDVHDVPGEHLTVLQPPYVAKLAQTLAEILEQSTSGNFGPERPA